MAWLDCFRGAIKDEKPTGREGIVRGLNTYIVEPGGGVTLKGIVVIITDAFGWRFPDNRLLSDHYAMKGGFLVYCPDFMNGSALDPSIIPIEDKVVEPGQAAWYVKPGYFLQAASMSIPFSDDCRIGKTKGGVSKFFQDLRTSEPAFPTDNLKIAVAGFCWGGKNTVILAADDPHQRVKRHESQRNHEELMPLLNCVFTAHPAYISLLGDFHALKIPTSAAIGTDDWVNKSRIAGTPTAYEMKSLTDYKERKGEFETHIYIGAKHGFAIQEHPDDELEVEIAQEAEVQALKWFEIWLS